MRPGCDTLNSLMYIFVRQGLVWLFIASVSEVIPVVRLFFLAVPSCSSPFHLTGVHGFKFEWYLFIPSNQSKPSVD